MATSSQTVLPAPRRGRHPAVHPAVHRTVHRTVHPAVWPAVALGVFAIWIATSLGGAEVTRYVDDLATAAAAGTAAVLCLRAARRHHGRNRTFWALLGAAAVSWTFAEGAWAVYDLVIGGPVPVPSYADIGYLGAIPLTLAALIMHPASHGSRPARARAFLDGSILATALLFLSWSFVLHDVWANNDLSTLGGIVTLTYPFGDVIIVFLLIRALRWLEGRDRVAVAWILLGLLAISFSDSGYTYLTVTHNYRSGNVIDIGWLAGYLGIALGGWYGSRSGWVRRRPPSQAGQSLSVLMPFVPLMLALGVLTVRARIDASIDRTSLVLAFVMIGSVLIRQAILLVDRYPHPGADDEDDPALVADLPPVEDGTDLTVTGGGSR